MKLIQEYYTIWKVIQLVLIFIFHIENYGKLVKWKPHKAWICVSIRRQYLLTGDYKQNLTLYFNKTICILRIVKNCCDVMLTSVTTGFCKSSCCVYVRDKGHIHRAF